MAEQRRIIGDDVGLYDATPSGSTITTSLAKDILVKIMVKGTGSAFGDLVVGDYFIHRKATPITMVDTDAYQVVTQVKMSDITSATIDISVDKVDTTALADAFKVARNGKSDLTGTVEFIYIKGVTDLPNTGILSSFFRSVAITASGVATVTAKRTTPYLLALWLDETDDVSGNHRILMVLQVEFESYTLGGSMGSAQTTSAPFHIVGGSPTTIYKIANA